LSPVIELDFTDFDFHAIKQELLNFGDSQVALQGRFTDDHTGTGKICDLPDDETKYTVPLYPELTNTNKLMASLGLYRSRLMTLNHKTCYTIHKDPSKRIHLPLQTTDRCLFVFLNGANYHLQEGKMYLVDTTKKHTAINAAKDPMQRIHLVGCLNVENFFSKKT